MIKLLSHSEILSFDNNEVESIKYLKQTLNKYDDDLDYYKFKITKDYVTKEPIILMTIASDHHGTLYND